MFYLFCRSVFSIFYFFFLLFYLFIIYYNWIRFYLTALQGSFFQLLTTDKKLEGN